MSSLRRILVLLVLVPLLSCFQQSYLTKPVQARPIQAEISNQAESAAEPPPKISAEAAEFFEREVRPLLLENCIGCHSQAVNKVKGGLNMDSRQSLIEGGDSGAGIDLQSPDKSLILEAVRRQSIEMPPDKPLSPQQVGVIEKWLKMGAPWPEHPSSKTGGENWVQRRASEHWSWKSIREVEVPVAIPGPGNEGWPKTAIDAFIYQKLQEQKITPSAPAARHELLRRLYFDLIGLPPTEEQLQQMTLVTDPSLLIDQLLASPQFGARWGRHWLDLMRYAETLGHEFDYPIRQAWRYRESVVNAFNDDVGYDRLIADHLAGDLNENPRIHPLTGVNESLASTAWWWLGDSVHAPVDVKNDWATRLENQVDVFSKTFLGMTIACARCHDHKFDPIGTSDYYGMVGVARSTRRRFAITDPHQKIAEHRKLLRDALDKARPQVETAWRGVQRDSVTRWLEQMIAHWRSLPADQLQQQLPLGSPLFALRLLVDQPPPGTDAESFYATRLGQLRQEFQRAQTEYSKWESESPLVADFSKGLPEGWKLEAIDREDLLRKPDAPSVDWFDSSIPLPARRNVLSSDAVGRSQFVTLRSPNFDLSKRCVCVKMRGKSTQSMVCVDGYFMVEVQGLLFADLRKPIDQPEDWGWVVHGGDLNKYIGDPTFLSLEAESSAWFQISEVRQADRGPPPSPHFASLKLLETGAASREAFEAVVIELLNQSFDAALASAALVSTVSTSGPEKDTQDLNPRIEVARAMLRHKPELLLGETAGSLQESAAKIQQLSAQAPAPTILIAAEEGDPSDCAIELRGNPHIAGDITPRGCLQSLTPWQEVQGGSSGRAELVASMTNPKHPLVARVMVNRVWYYLMGRGLANSPDNLGVLGSRPSHPELLDYLAQQFMQNDWSIKWLVREIVSSQTYALSSTPLGEHATSDPEGSLYSHRIVRRLDAEVLRDAMIQTCGSLDLQLTGPSVPIHLTEQMTGRGRPGSSGPLDGNNRRSVFLEVRRNFLNPFLMAFDFPMPSTTTGKRNVSNVPAQALGLLNDPLVDELAKRWAAQTSSIGVPRERIERMITVAFSRPATEAELDRCAEFVAQSGESGWIDLAHTLINAKEFWYLK